jgi:hypothetical protein
MDGSHIVVSRMSSIPQFTGCWLACAAIAELSICVLALAG